MADFEKTFFSGERLFGDDFDPDAIRLWYAEEENGYFDLTQTYGQYVYGYHALNAFHAYRFLGSHYRACLAYGCARGDDVAPLAARVARFIALEPAEQWWSNSIAGTPAQYLKPSPNGNIPLANASVDLIVCLGVLHHIPNASHVFSEMVRVLSPGGHLVLREPICTMGDWRRPRRGLTRNERGFPPRWMEARAAAGGLQVLRKAHCVFPLTTRLARALRVEPAFNRRPLVRLDALFSFLFRWNLHYHRDSLLKKIAPIDIYYIFGKPPF